MVSVRFFSFVLLFMLVHIGESSALSQVREKVVVPDARKQLAKLSKEAYDALPAVAEVGNSRLKARKMMSKLDKKTVKVENSDGEEEKTKISGADYDQSVGESSHREKGILNVNRKVLRNRNPLPDHRHGQKPQMAGFTAFSADYHVPRPHPPKNN